MMANFVVGTNSDSDEAPAMVENISTAQHAQSADDLMVHPPPSQDVGQQTIPHQILAQEDLDDILKSAFGEMAVMDAKTDDGFYPSSGGKPQVSTTNTTWEERCFDSDELYGRYKQEGNDLFKNGDIEASIQCYSKAIDVNNTDSRIFTNRSAAYFRLGHYELSIVDADTAIRINPQGEKGYYRKACAHRKLNHSVIADVCASIANYFAAGRIQFPADVFTDTGPQLCTNITRISSLSPDIKGHIERSTYSSTIFLVESGTYNIPGPIYLAGNRLIAVVGLGQVNLAGNGAAIRIPATMALMGSGNGQAVYMSNVCISNVHDHALSCQARCELAVEYCSFENVDQAAVALCGGSKCLLRHSLVKRCGGTGILAADPDTEVTLYACHILNGEIFALEVREGAKMNATECILDGNNKGILCWDKARYFGLEDSSVRNCRSEGILLRDNLIAVLKGNEFLQPGLFGISCDFQANIVATENIIQGAKTHGVYVKGGSHASLKSNDISRCFCAGVAIGMNYAGKVLLEGNYIHHNKGRHGVEIEAEHEAFKVKQKQLNEAIRRGLSPEMMGFSLPRGETRIFSDPPLMRDNRIEHNNVNISAMPAQHRTCNACGKSTGSKSSVCAQCFSVEYCNIECQKQHRKQHKKTCKATLAERSVVLNQKDHQCCEEEIQHIAPPVPGAKLSSYRRSDRSGARIIVKAQTNAWRASGKSRKRTHIRATTTGHEGLTGPSCDVKLSQVINAMNKDFEVFLYNRSREFYMRICHENLYNFITEKGVPGAIGLDTKKLYLFAKWERGSSGAVDHLRVFFRVAAPLQSW